MKIALVAPPEEPVPPRAYGGSELVVYNLCRELVKMGHSVTLLASGDSKTPATLVPIIPLSLRAAESDAIRKAFREQLKILYVGKQLEVLEDGDFDIIHNHNEWQLLPFARRIKNRLITTTHLPFLSDPAQRMLYEPYKDYAFVSLSLRQREGLPTMNYVGNVYNGIEVDNFTVGAGDGGYLAFLGRMSPSKGPMEAIKIAKATGMKLKMAAKVDEVDKAYFEEKIKPLIDGEQIEFIGEIGHERKVEFLGHARALLEPINWEEPFGLVTIEAFACGTPVIAIAKGALPEVIDDGKVGFLCNSVDEMVERVKQLGDIDRGHCRSYVESRFTARIMAENYLAIYKQFLGSQT